MPTSFCPHAALLWSEAAAAEADVAPVHLWRAGAVWSTTLGLHVSMHVSMHTNTLLLLLLPVLSCRTLSASWRQQQWNVASA